MSATTRGEDLEVPVRRGWMALRFAALTLLVPREDVAGRIGIEGLVSAGDAEDGPAAWAELEGERVPVYRLDDELRPAAPAREGELGAVVVRSAGRVAALACEQVRELDAPEAVDIKPVPACLENDESPVTALGLYETIRVGLVVSGADLLRHLNVAAYGGG